MIERFLTVALVVQLVSCVSSRPKVVDVSLPAVFESFFSMCSDADGALNVQVYQADSLKGASELEWIAEKSKGWRAEMINPLGRSLLLLEFDQAGQVITQNGPLARSLPTVKVENGFLNIDGHFIGLKPEELGCFLNFKLPRSWLASAVDYQQMEEKLILDFWADERKMHTEISGLSENLNSNTCTTISWSRFWGLSSTQIQICYELSKGRIGQMNGVGDFLVKWVDIDG